MNVDYGLVALLADIWLHQDEDTCHIAQEPMAQFVHLIDNIVRFEAFRLFDSSVWDIT